MSSLWAAAKAGDAAAVRRHLADGTHVDAKKAEFFGETALHFACVAGKEAVVVELLARGADIAAVSDLDRRTPLHYAAMHGHRAIVGLLLRQGADPNVKDRHDATPAVLAYMNDHHDMAKELLDPSGALLAAATVPVREPEGLGAKHDEDEFPSLWKTAAMMLLAMALALLAVMMAAMVLSDAEAPVEEVWGSLGSAFGGLFGVSGSGSGDEDL